MFLPGSREIICLHGLAHYYRCAIPTTSMIQTTSTLLALLACHLHTRMRLSTGTDDAVNDNELRRQQHAGWEEPCARTIWLTMGWLWRDHDTGLWSRPPGWTLLTIKLNGWLAQMPRWLALVADLQTAGQQHSLDFGGRRVSKILVIRSQRSKVVYKVGAHSTVPWGWSVGQRHQVGFSDLLPDSWWRKAESYSSW